MVIAVSGSGGCGKTSVLAKLAELGYSVVSRKTSRSILTDWGVSLTDVNSNPELTLKFQDEILERKLADDTAQVEHEKPGAIVFTERSMIDLWTYACLALGSNNSCSDWLDEYYRKCLAAQQIYDKVYYLTAGHFKPEHDGVRGSNSHYSRMADMVMVDNFKRMTQPSRQCVIDTPNFADRIAIITAHNPL